MNQTERKQLEDNFTIIEKISSKYFSEIENSVPHFQQELFDLQNECYKTWKNMINTNISLQKEFTDKAGISFSLPETSQTIIKNTSEGFANFCSIRDKAAIAAIQTARKNIKAWNGNADMFMEWNKNMVQYIASIFASSPEK